MGICFLGAGARYFFLVVAIMETLVSSHRMFSDSLWCQRSYFRKLNRLWSSENGWGWGRTVAPFRGSHRILFLLCHFYWTLWNSHTVLWPTLSVLSLSVLRLLSVCSHLLDFLCLLQIPHDVFFWQLHSLHWTHFLAFQCCFGFIFVFVLWFHWNFAKWGV